MFGYPGNNAATQQVKYKHIGVTKRGDHDMIQTAKVWLLRRGSGAGGYKCLHGELARNIGFSCHTHPVTKREA
jgi:hypothetical protein